jgi:hypothetical protein
VLEMLVTLALVIPPAASAIVDAAIADAASRFAVQAQAISVERVTWRDGSLGCPQPDMAYTQALIPGWRIKLAAGDRILDYHASERGRVIHCPPGRAKQPLPDSRT